MTAFFQIPLAVLTVVAIAFLVGLAATRLAIPVLTRRVLDVPNDRSSHTTPTPRGGGLGVMAGVLVGWAGGILLYPETSQATAIALLAGLLLMIVSFLDDLKPRPASVRLVAQIIAVAIGLYALGHGAFRGLVPGPVDLALTGFLWLWFLNLFNFMDGIDGLAGGEGISVGFGLGLAAVLGLAPADILPLGWSIAAAALGFLVWNWHPARIFMGDVGSVPAGYLLGFLLIRVAAAETGTMAPHAGLAIAVILPLYFVMDASITLVRRLLRGEKPTEAHREHVYQRAVIAGQSHSAVTTRILVLNALLVALAVLAAPLLPLPALGMAVILVLVGFRILLAPERARGRESLS
jgi:UDP-N-acetylmuramyl pentapeptide phosphotransferase/UDP-N-acetylglucosamine-1-phosphate transferase